jgi:hypothetical protein
MAKWAIERHEVANVHLFEQRYAGLPAMHAANLKMPFTFPIGKVGHRVTARRTDALDIEAGVLAWQEVSGCICRESEFPDVVCDVRNSNQASRRALWQDFRRTVRVEPNFDRQILGWHTLARQVLGLAQIAFSQAWRVRPEILDRAGGDLKLATSAASRVAFVWKADPSTQGRTEHGVGPALGDRVIQAFDMDGMSHPWNPHQ